MDGLKPDAIPPGDIRHILDHLPDGVIGIDAQQKIVYFNASAEAMFGYPSVAIENQPLEILVPEGHRADHAAHAERFLASELGGRYMNDRREISGLRRNGTRFPAEASIVRLRAPGPMVVLAIVRDITERKAAEQALAESDAIHRAILAASPDAILIADANTGHIIAANDAAGTLFGGKSADLVGVPQWKLHPPEHRETYERYFREHITDNRVFVPDAEIMRLDGVVTPVEIAAQPKVISGRYLMVGFFRDLSYRKQREQELTEALARAEAASQARTMLFSSINHELRTPLNCILGMAEVIGMELFGPVGHPKYREYAQDIQLSGKHLNGLIRDLLYLSSIELGGCRLEEEAFCLREVLQDCRKMVVSVAEMKGIDLALPDMDEPIVLHADRRKTMQMLLNLLTNAIKFTPEGGRVTVACGVEPSRGFFIDVADTGTGFRPDYVNRLGQPFLSTGEPFVKDQQGIGLGLSITKGMIEHHGGNMEIKNCSGGSGARVRLTFPLARLRGSEHAPQ